MGDERDINTEGGELRKCKVCGGEGKIIEIKKCPDCGGKGYLADQKIRIMQRIGKIVSEFLPCSTCGGTKEVNQEIFSSATGQDRFYLQEYPEFIFWIINYGTGEIKTEQICTACNGQGVVRI